MYSATTASVYRERETETARHKDTEFGLSVSRATTATTAAEQQAGVSSLPPPMEGESCCGGSRDCLLLCRRLLLPVSWEGKTGEQRSKRQIKRCSIPTLSSLLGYIHIPLWCTYTPCSVFSVPAACDEALVAAVF